MITYKNIEKYRKRNDVKAISRWKDGKYLMKRSIKRGDNRYI